VNGHEEVLKTLGLDKLPDPRIPVPDSHPPPGNGLLNFKKAVQLVDYLETAAFTKYIPDGVNIDQSMDSASFDPEASRCISLRTDLPIPSNRKVFGATGIGAEPNAQNHYLWLAQELGKHVEELGARAIAPPLVFRTNGANGTVPFLGLIMKLDLHIPDGKTVLDQGANWALMGPRAPEVRLEGDESPSDVT